MIDYELVLLGFGLLGLLVAVLYTVHRRGWVRFSGFGVKASIGTSPKSGCSEPPVVDRCPVILKYGEHNTHRADDRSNPMRTELMAAYQDAKERNVHLYIEFDEFAILNSFEKGALMRCIIHFVRHNCVPITIRIVRGKIDNWSIELGSPSDAEKKGELYIACAQGLRERNEDRAGEPGYTPAPTTGIIKCNVQFVITYTEREFQIS